MLEISVENTCAEACKFIKKRLQYKCFLVNFLRTPFSTEQLQWLLFKIKNSNKLWIAIQRYFSDISYAQPISDGLQLSQWETNLKMQSLPKLVLIEHFCSRFRTNCLLPKIWTEVKLFARCSLLVTFCSLLFARCSLLFVPCSLLFARCSLSFTRYSTGNSEGFSWV